MKKVITFVLTILITTVTVPALAHPGNTDQYGGHYDHDNTSYHYHSGQFNGVYYHNISHADALAKAEEAYQNSITTPEQETYYDEVFAQMERDYNLTVAKQWAEDARDIEEAKAIALEEEKLLLEAERTADAEHRATVEQQQLQILEQLQTLNRTISYTGIAIAFIAIYLVVGKVMTYFEQKKKHP